MKAVNRFRTLKIEKEADKNAGYRERYAMIHGNMFEDIQNGHLLYIFKYSKENEYQDANGATYDATRGAWIK